MREKLAEIKYDRESFQGTVSKFGTKPGYKGPSPTICLVSIVKTKTGEEVTDHLWFNLTKRFLDLHLQIGDVVKFVARVLPYFKGYVHRDEDNRELDYKLSHPSQCSVVSRCAPYCDAVPHSITQYSTVPHSVVMRNASESLPLTHINKPFLEGSAEIVMEGNKKQLLSTKLDQFL